MTLLRDTIADSTDGTRDATHYVLGGGAIGTAIAEQLRAAGHRVAVVNDSSVPSDIPGLTGDPSAVDTLADAGVATASTVVVVTPSDRRNLLIAQLVRARFDVPRVVVFVYDPNRIPLFADAGHEPFCVTTALADTFGETV